jgi:hypothetical protein
VVDIPIAFRLQAMAGDTEGDVPPHPKGGEHRLRAVPVRAEGLTAVGDPDNLAEPNTEGTTPDGSPPGWPRGFRTSNGRHGRVGR